LVLGYQKHVFVELTTANISCVVELIIQRQYILLRKQH
jgi:hypothetical protein